MITRELRDLIDNKDNILEQCVQNIDHIKRLSPSSLNTLRFFTFVHNDGSVEIINAILRMGNGKGVTDNFTSGGILCPIDLKTGKLKATAQGKEDTQFTHHPFSCIRFEGFQIPDWDNVLNAVYEIAGTYPEAKFVGWDLAQTPNGLVLIEGNIPPGEDVFQIGNGRGMKEELNKRLNEH